MNCVNKKLPANQAGSSPKRLGGGEENELSAFLFFQEVAAFAGRVNTEDYNHRHKNN